MSLVRKGRVDPIEILREYIVQKKQIKQKKDKNGNLKLQFDNTDLKCSMETAWKSTKSNREYNLGALWWFLESKLKKIETKEYRSKAIEMKLDFVGMVDQQEIEDYFTGKIDYTECINAERKSQLFKKLSQKEDLSAYKNDQHEPQLTKKIKSDEEEKKPLNEQEFNLRVLEEILRFEKPITTKNRQLRCFDRTFENVLEVSKKQLFGQQKGNEKDEDHPLSYNRSLLQEILQSKQKPLIIVPSIFEIGNLCLKNIKTFLQNGEYTDPSQTKFSNESRSVDVIHYISHLKQEVTFEVRDSPNTFDQATWKRVVAIFLRGSSYELKGFPNASDIVYFFKRYRGYHMRFDEDKPKDQIKQWNIKVLQIHRNRRHYDQSVKQQFWEDLESFLLRPIYQDKQK